MARIVMLMHEEGGAFGASFPDLPGCTTVASSPDALIAKAPEVVLFHLEGLAEDDGDAPPFRTLADLRSDPEFRSDAQDATVVLLEIARPRRSVRVNIMIDETTLKRIDRAAADAGETRSGFLAAAARARLQAAE